MAWKWTTEDIFLALAIPAAVSAVAMLALHWAMSEHAAARPQVTAPAAAQ